jgi:predicted ferric reductase
MARHLPPSRRSKGLPPLLLAVLYVAVAAVPLALAGFSGIESAGAWTEAAAAAGMIGAVMLTLQLVSSGRFEALSGRIGIDVTMAFHKWAARVLVALVLLHPLLFLAPVDPTRLGVAFNHLAAMLTAPRQITGVVALVIVVAAVLLAIFRDRLPLPYEAWRASHGVMALAATWATVAHLAAVGTYSDEPALMAFWLALAFAATAAALGVYTIRAWRMRHQTWRLAGRRKLAERLWEVTLRGAPGERLSFQAGQFAWLALGPHRFPLFDHPFSIASAPQEDGTLRFIMQEAGDFTGAIGSVPLETPAGIDAPHGSFTLQGGFTLQGDGADALLLIAGGVGIAPILSLLRDIATKGDRRPVRLLYGARNPAALIDPAEIQPLLDGLNARATFLVDEPTPDWPYGVGPVSKERLEEALQGLDPQRVAAMVCGPGPMLTAVTENLYARGVPYRAIRYERFDYAAGAPTGKDRRVMAGFWAMALALLAASAAFAFR